MTDSRSSLTGSPNIDVYWCDMTKCETHPQTNTHIIIHAGTGMGAASVFIREYLAIDAERLQH